MSLVIGLKHNNQIYLATDSQVTINGVKKKVHPGHLGKVWYVKPHNTNLMGSVGWVRERNIIQTTQDLIEDPGRFEKTPYTYLVQSVIPKMLKTIKKHKAQTIMDDKHAFQNRYLMTAGSRLFEIDKDGSVIEIDTFTAIGSGSNEAMAYLDSATVTDPINTLVSCIDNASKNDIYVARPVVVIDTKTGLYQKFE